jgi:hypothetical protein
MAQPRSRHARAGADATTFPKMFSARNSLGQNGQRWLPNNKVACDTAEVEPFDIGRRPSGCVNVRTKRRLRSFERVGTVSCLMRRKRRGPMS